MKKATSPALHHRHFSVVLRPEPEGGFTVLVPSLPGCITYGKNLEEAKKMAQEAIELFVEDMVAEGEPIPPQDNAYLGIVEIELPRTPSPVHHG